MKFAIKAIWQYPLYLRHVATLPWEIKHSNFLQIFSRYGRKRKQIAFLIACNWLWIFFYLLTFTINLWHRKYVTADVTAVFVNNQHGIQRRGQEFVKSLYLKGYTAKRLTDKFPEKSWTKRSVNRLLKKLQDTGTVDRRPGGGRPRSAHTEENVETVNDLTSQCFRMLKYFKYSVIH